MDDKRKIIPGSIPTSDFHQFMVGLVSPRPIALVTTKSEDGVLNAAPYSFFNAFSSNPPIVVFSSNRRVSNNTTKDTLHNLELNKELVINMVSHAIVRQMALCSIEYDSHISEFDKAGFTPIASDMIDVPRVAESPAALECKVRDIITLGDQGGAGHLIICDVVCMHIEESVINERNRIDPQKLDIMGRLGRSYYVRASGEAVQTIVQSVSDLGIGFDQLPHSITHSTILTGNEIAQLASNINFPTEDEVEFLKDNDEKIKFMLADQAGVEAYHTYIAQILATRNTDLALKVGLFADRWA